MNRRRLRRGASLAGLGVALLGLTSVAAGAYIIWQRLETKMLQNRVNQLERQGQELDARLSLLRVQNRTARLEVVRRETQGGRDRHLVRFQETDERGNPLGQPLERWFEGTELHVEAQLVKFNNEYIEGQDPLRGTSMLIFQRLYSDTMAPDDGVSIDSVGVRPLAYRTPGPSATNYSRTTDDNASRLQREIFRRFWELTTNETLRREQGVDFAQWVAPSIRMTPGARYDLRVGAGGLTMQPSRSQVTAGPSPSPRSPPSPAPVAQNGPAEPSSSVVTTPLPARSPASTRVNSMEDPWEDQRVAETRP